MPHTPYTSKYRHRIATWRVAGLVTIASIAAACADSPVSISPASDAPAPSASVATIAGAKPSHYSVIDLGTFGGPFSIAFDVNDAGRVVGAATVADGSQHAFQWRRGKMMDLGTLGGSNSQASGRAGGRALAILSETQDVDPLGEDICGFHTGLVCRAAVWHAGVLTTLPTLGGVNASAIEINNRGELIGVSDDGIADATCAPPQKGHFQAVVWGPKAGEIHKLPPLPGDEVGFALKNNDKGQVVGSTGPCSKTTLSGLAKGPHAVLWTHGSPVDLGNLGGHDVNVAVDINNRGQVIGGAGLPDGTMHPFMWTKATGIRDLGLLSTDPADAANTPFAINDRGQVVGGSCDVTLATCRAYLWQNGTMTDLNDLIPADSPLYLISPFGLNNNGAIAGLAVVKSTGEAHAFLAVPVSGKADDDGPHARHEGHGMPLPEGMRALFLHTPEAVGHNSR